MQNFVDEHAGMRLPKRESPPILPLIPYKMSIQPAGNAEGRGPPYQLVVRFRIDAAKKVVLRSGPLRPPKKGSICRNKLAWQVSLSSGRSLLNQSTF